MSIPKFQTVKEISELDEAEVILQLTEKFSITPIESQCYNDGFKDPILDGVPPCVCVECRRKVLTPTQLKQVPTLSPNASMLHHAPFEKWASGLTESQVLAELKALKIPVTAWQKRANKLEEFRKVLLQSINYQDIPNIKHKEKK